jgi:hypothetical protein
VYFVHLAVLLPPLVPRFLIAYNSTGSHISSFRPFQRSSRKILLLTDPGAALQVEELRRAMEVAAELRAEVGRGKADADARVAAERLGGAERLKVGRAPGRGGGGATRAGGPEWCVIPGGAVTQRRDPYIIRQHAGSTTSWPTKRAPARVCPPKGCHYQHRPLHVIPTVCLKSRMHGPHSRPWFWSEMRLSGS